MLRAQGESDPLLEVTVGELERAAAALSSDGESLYWLSFGQVDKHTFEVQATSGSASEIACR